MRKTNHRKTTLFAFVVSGKKIIPTNERRNAHASIYFLCCIATPNIYWASPVETHFFFFTVHFDSLSHLILFIRCSCMLLLFLYPTPEKSILSTFISIMDSIVVHMRALTCVRTCRSCVGAAWPRRIYSICSVCFESIFVHVPCDWLHTAIDVSSRARTLMSPFAGGSNAIR